MVYNARNKNYDTGAYWYAYNRFKKANFFYFLQDFHNNAVQPQED